LPLTLEQIQKAYLDTPLQVPKQWNLSRKHIRVVANGSYLKLNTIENRINENELRFYCYKLRPTHVYFSVLNWLFPERVGRKYKAKYCIPLNGEYVVDIDSYLAHFPHIHRYNKEWNICERCLLQSKILTLNVLETLEHYYKDFAVVFSGRSGFHVHVLDFNYRDWVGYRESDPIWCHHASRFRLTRVLQKQTRVFDKAHFNVSVDPMRVVTVPNTINAKTGLVCRYLGNRKTFEKLSIPQIFDKSKTFGKFSRYRTSHSYPEPLENPSWVLSG
jgi:DNA primase catalytic subunit